MSLLERRKAIMLTRLAAGWAALALLLAGTPQPSVLAKPPSLPIDPKVKYQESPSQHEIHSEPINNNHPLYCWGLRFEGKDDHGKLWPVRGLARRQAMARRSPQGMDVATVVLEPVEPLCGECRRQMHVRSHRRRRIYSLAGPLLVDCKLMHCPLAACPNHRGTFSPEQDLTLAVPCWLVGWDV